MRFQKDYFLEDYYDIFCIDTNCIVVVYDTLLHQPLDKYLENGDVNIIVNSKKVDKIISTQSEWVLLKECTITHIQTHQIFISYTIRWNGILDELSIHLQRKLKIKKLFTLQQSVNLNV